MRYFLDCEFMKFRGEIISLALVGDNDDELYLAREQSELEAYARAAGDLMDPWVRENVLPIIDTDEGAALRVGSTLADVRRQWPAYIAGFLKNQKTATIVVDWPDDIKYFCELLITGPGECVNIPGIVFEWHRVDAYPTDLRGAVQHNALSDARALRRFFQKREAA